MNRNYTNLLIVSVFVLLASCATLSDDQKYERADRYLQARENFELQKISCSKAGGYMQISYRIKPTRHDYRYAKCVRHG